MALSYKARKRWALVTLVIGMPVYVVAVVSLLSLLDQPPFLLQLALYIALGIVWIMPLKALFRGIGQPDPDARPEDRR